MGGFFLSGCGPVCSARGIKNLLANDGRFDFLFLFQNIEVLAQFVFVLAGQGDQVGEGQRPAADGIQQAVFQVAAESRYFFAAVGALDDFDRQIGPPARIFSRTAKSADWTPLYAGGRSRVFS